MSPARGEAASTPAAVPDNAPGILLSGPQYRLKLSDPTRARPRFRFGGVDAATLRAQYPFNGFVGDAAPKRQFSGYRAPDANTPLNDPAAIRLAPGSGSTGGQQRPSRLTLKSTAPMTLMEDPLSGWARWNSTLPGVTATVVTFMVEMVVGFTALPSDETGWTAPTFRGLRDSFTQGPRFDNDRTYWNYVAHPIDGSEFYLIARNRNCNWWQSFAYSAALSTFWEFFVETSYERASWQDLWITPVTGAFIGELRWQAKKALEDPKTKKPVGTLNKVLYVVIDPLDAVFNL
jgi:hypothetical protein